MVSDLGKCGHSWVRTSDPSLVRVVTTTPPPAACSITQVTSSRTEHSGAYRSYGEQNGLPFALPRVSRSSRPVTCRSSSRAAHWSGTSGLTRIRQELFLPLPGRIHQEQNPARTRAEEDRGLIPLEGLRLDIPIPEGRDEHGGLRLGPQG